MGHKGPAVVNFRELSADGSHYSLDNVIFIEEVNFAFCRMHVDIDPLGLNIEGQVDERMTTFREKGCIYSRDSLFDCG